MSWCKYKIPHATEEGALAVRSLRIAARGPSWKFTSAYRCKRCGHWHLGNKGKRR